MSNNNNNNNNNNNYHNNDYIPSLSGPLLSLLLWIVPIVIVVIVVNASLGLRTQDNRTYRAKGGGKWAED